MLVKLEWLGYRMVKKLWRYVKPFSSDIGTLRTDGRTDRQTDWQIWYMNIARQYADARYKRHDVIFQPWVVRFGQNFANWSQWHVDCGDMVEIETGSSAIWLTFWSNSMACHPRATCRIVGCCYLAHSVTWSQSYVPYCRVLPPNKFNVMI